MEANIRYTETLSENYFFTCNLQISNITKISILFLIIYIIPVLFILISNEVELHDKATCCGLYGYYERYFLPFPTIKSSALSHWGGGPTKLLYFNIVENIMIPLVIFFVPQLVTKLKKLNIR